MLIRRASSTDIPGIDRLLDEVNEIHHSRRPDLFKRARKYTDEQLKALIINDERPIFVAVGDDAEAGAVLGYAFCVHQRIVDDNIRTNVRTLYIDDLCVDEGARGTHVGSKLFDHVMGYARSHGCHNVTLNVWALNEGAMRFYESMGMRPLSSCMEVVL